MDGLGRTVATSSHYLAANKLDPSSKQELYSKEDDFIYLDLLGIRCNGGLEQEAPLGCYQMIICLLSIIIRVLVTTLAWPVSQAVRQSGSQAG